jgi:hypothetical protein
LQKSGFTIASDTNKNAHIHGDYTGKPSKTAKHTMWYFILA